MKNYVIDLLLDQYCSWERTKNKLIINKSNLGEEYYKKALKNIIDKLIDIGNALKILIKYTCKPE